MREYPAHAWPYVLSSLRDLATANAYFDPMARFVEELAASPYAAALYPQLSMHTLYLSQQPTVSNYTERLGVTWKDGKFVVCYQGGPSAPVWEKRDSNGMRALRRLFEHLRWFTEYRESPPDAAIQRDAAPDEGEDRSV
jgi:hypothetical protein